MATRLPLLELVEDVSACRVCAAELPLGPRPVLRVSSTARLLIIGQAPGTRVHASGIPWDDVSGERLRDWLGLDSTTFYDSSRVAIMPMGFCYPGKGAGGDLPPRRECAPLWHGPLLQRMPRIRLTLLIGRYAHQYYLGPDCGSVTECVRNWRRFQPRCFPLVHPSPRNRRWLANNRWFEAETVPVLRQLVAQVLGK